MTTAHGTPTTATPTAATRTAALPDFYRYPTGRLVAVLDGPDASRHLLDGLADAGVALDAVQVMEGEDGRRRLDRDGTRHGVLARAHRALVGALTSDSQSPLTLLDLALRRGGTLIAIPCRPSRGPRDDELEDLVLEHGAVMVWRFTRWTVSARHGLRHGGRR